MSMKSRRKGKRCERLSLYDAIDQARRDAGERIPIVAHRRNSCHWLAVLELADLLAILRESSLVVSLPGEHAA